MSTTWGRWTITIEGGTAVIPENRIPTHPGVVLSQEFLAPLGLSQVAPAAHVGVPVQRINELVRGKRGITPETAWLLAQALNTSR
jgi:antitoxin HigA-1